MAAIALLLAALPASAAATTAAAASLRANIASVLAKDHLAGPSTAVLVWDATSSRTLFSYHASTVLVPASNTKLATSAAALARWGPDYRFKTELYATALPLLPPYGIGEIVGNIYIKGYGDPSLSTRAYQKTALHFSTARLESFVARLKAMGVTRITGAVVADDSYFDRVYACPGWRPDFVRTQLGTLSALPINGDLYDGSPIPSPPMCTAATLTQMLKGAGIVVGASPRMAIMPESSVLVCTVRSAPLSTLVRHMNKMSDNFYAEMLTKGLGAAFRGSGSTTAGVSVTRSYLTTAGIDSSAYRLYDGSGLSYWNRLSPDDLVRLLRVQAGYPYAATYAGSLSIAGIDGTLRHRMRGTAARRRLVAKTGSLAISCCLSGYVSSAGGHRLTFSMMMNGSPLSYAAATHAQDAIGVTLAATRSY